MNNLTPEQRAEAVKWLRDQLAYYDFGSRGHTSLVRAIFALESEPTKDAEIAGLAEQVRGLREALEKLQRKVVCGQHRPLRNPLCGDCQVLTAIETALATPLPEAAKVAQENAEKAGLLDHLFTYAKVTKAGRIEFHIPLPQSADWEGVTCIWDERVFLEALRAAKKANNE